MSTHIDPVRGPRTPDAFVGRASVALPRLGSLPRDLLDRVDTEVIKKLGDEGRALGDVTAWRVIAHDAQLHGDDIDEICEKVRRERAVVREVRRVYRYAPAGWRQPDHPFNVTLVLQVHAGACLTLDVTAHSRDGKLSLVSILQALLDSFAADVRAEASFASHGQGETANNPLLRSVHLEIHNNTGTITTGGRDVSMRGGVDAAKPWEPTPRRVAIGVLVGLLTTYLGSQLQHLG